MSVIAGAWNRGLLVLGCICAISPPAGAEVVKPVVFKPVVRWVGTLKDATLQTKGPATGILNSQGDFEKLWKVWRGTEAVPEVDFAAYVVLVAPFARNRVFIYELAVNEERAASVIPYTPADREPQMIDGFAYTFVVVPREKVRSYSGNLIPAAPK